jgi:anti-sigma factor RsiW
MAECTMEFREHRALREALDELDAMGIPRERVRVTRTERLDPISAPRSLFGMSHALAYALAFAFPGGLVGIWISRVPGQNAPGTLWLFAFGALLGASLGSGVGAVVGALRKAQWRDRTAAVSWTLRVDAPDGIERTPSEKPGSWLDAMRIERDRARRGDVPPVDPARIDEVLRRWGGRAPAGA